MANVHLRRITRDNLRACLDLQLADGQQKFVATPARSLAEAYVDSNLFPFAIYDVAARGFEQPEVPVVGFAMYEIVGGVGFIMRLMLDKAHQRQGYGRAAVLEMIRRLKLSPDVEIIATSHVKDNQVAAELYSNLGFRPWDISWAIDHPEETYLKLEDDKPSAVR